jgi:hypothetical protein
MLRHEGLSLGLVNVTGKADDACSLRETLAVGVLNVFEGDG